MRVTYSPGVGDALTIPILEPLGVAVRVENCPEGTNAVVGELWTNLPSAGFSADWHAVAGSLTASGDYFRVVLLPTRLGESSSVGWKCP